MYIFQRITDFPRGRACRNCTRCKDDMTCEVVPWLKVTERNLTGRCGFYTQKYSKKDFWKFVLLESWRSKTVDYKKRYDRISNSKEFISSYSNGKSDTENQKIR